MKTPDPLDPRAGPRRRTLAFAGAGGLAGAAALLLGNAAGSALAPRYDWVSDTVSDLAEGPLAWVQDLAMHAYAAGLLASAWGALRRPLDGTRWTVGAWLLVANAVIVSVIAVRGAYGAGPFGLHMMIVGALGVVSAAAPLAMERGLSAVSRLRGRVALGAGLVWAIGGPMFFLVPTGWDGAWERALGLASAVFVATLSLTLLEAAGGVSALRARGVRP